MVRTWVDVARSYLRSPIVGRLWGILVLLILYALGIDFLHPEKEWLKIDSRFHLLQGTILGLLLVFRTNTAYDRWWEGRKLWGQLVNDLRNLALKVRHCVDASDEEKRQFGDLLVVFAWALREHLSWKPASPHPLAPDLPPDEPRHVPLLVAGRIFEKLNAWEKQGALNQILIFDAHSRGLMDVCGACERIKKTPIARSYLVFIRLCIVFYLLTLPWGLINDYHLWTVPASAIIGYFMIGIELIAEDVEQPFGRGGDKLNLESICHGIERSVRETLGG
jgi:putative membrane protein